MHMKRHKLSFLHPISVVLLTALSFPGYIGAPILPRVHRERGGTNISLTVPIPPAIDGTWPLTFEDHFDRAGVDWTKWRDGGQNYTNGRNGELQKEFRSASPRMSSQEQPDGAKPRMRCVVRCHRLLAICSPKV